LGLLKKERKKLDDKELEAVKKRYTEWRDSVRVTLNEDGTGYIVKGDERVPEEIVDGVGDEHPFVLPRVTGLIDHVIHKGDGFYNQRPLKLAMDFLAQEHIQVRSSTIEEYEEIMMQASGIASAHMEEAANFGLKTHSILEDIQNSRTSAGYPSYRHGGEHQPAIDAWYEWMENSGLEPIASEQGLYYHDESSSNAPISFAGKADLIALDGHGIPVIVDYKTGKQQMNHALQLSAYALALSYCGLGRFLDTHMAQKIRAVALYLPKEEGGKLKAREVNDVSRQQQVFLYACKIRQWQSGRGKWKNWNG